MDLRPLELSLITQVLCRSLAIENFGRGSAPARVAKAVYDMVCVSPGPIAISPLTSPDIKKASGDSTFVAGSTGGSSFNIIFSF